MKAKQKRSTFKGNRVLHQNVLKTQSVNKENGNSARTTASMLTAAPGVYRQFMEGRDKVPYVGPVHLGSKK